MPNLNCNKLTDSQMCVRRDSSAVNAVAEMTTGSQHLEHRGTEAVLLLQVTMTTDVDQLVH